MATVSALVTAIVVSGTMVHATQGEDLRNVIITGFGELPYEPAPGWTTGGFFRSDVFPVDVNSDDGLPQTMDVALRTTILVEDPNEKKPSSDGTENNSAEDVAKSSSNNNQKTVENNSSLDQDKAKEIEEELLTARTISGLRKLNGQRNTREKQTPDLTVPRGSVFQYHPRQPTPDYGSNGYNNREYYGDIGEGWSLQDAEEVLGGKNYNVLTQHPNSYYPPALPPPREIPPPRFPPNSFYPFPSFGYNPFLPPPNYNRNGRMAYRGMDVPTLRDDVVYGRSTDTVRQPSSRRDIRVYPYFDDYLSGA